VKDEVQRGEFSWALRASRDVPPFIVVYVPYLDANAKNSGDYLMYAKALALWKYTAIVTIPYQST